MSLFSTKKKINWIHITEPTTEQLQSLIDEYGLHAIIADDLLSGNIQDKVDIYDNHIFLVTHFPKYDTTKDKYYANALYMIVGVDYIVTIGKYPTGKLLDLYTQYQESLQEKKMDPLMKKSYYVLYKIIDIMYDKILLALARFSQDIQSLEQELFSQKSLNTKMLSSLLVKRRNIIYVHHMIAPQGEIFAELHKAIENLFNQDGNIYFEDLQYKFDKISRTIQTADANTRSLSTTYNALANIHTNSVISLLTIFTASIGILAVVTGLYGMNVELPGQDNPNVFAIIIVGMFILLVGVLFFAKKKNRR